MEHFVVALTPSQVSVVPPLHISFTLTHYPCTTRYACVMFSCAFCELFFEPCLYLECHDSIFCLDKINSIMFPLRREKAVDILFLSHYVTRNWQTMTIFFMINQNFALQTTQSKFCFTYRVFSTPVLFHQPWKQAEVVPWTRITRNVPGVSPRWRACVWTVWLDKTPRFAMVIHVAIFTRFERLSVSFHDQNVVQIEDTMLVSVVKIWQLQILVRVFLPWNAIAHFNSVRRSLRNQGRSKLCLK